MRKELGYGQLHELLFAVAIGTLILALFLVPGYSKFLVLLVGALFVCYRRDFLQLTSTTKALGGELATLAQEMRSSDASLDARINHAEQKVTTLASKMASLEAREPVQREGAPFMVSAPQSARSWIFPSAVAVFSCLVLQLLGYFLISNSLQSVTSEVALLHSRLNSTVQDIEHVSLRTTEASAHGEQALQTAHKIALQMNDTFDLINYNAWSAGCSKVFSLDGAVRYCRNKRPIQSVGASRSGVTLTGGGITNRAAQHPLLGVSAMAPLTGDEVRARLNRE